MCQFNSVPFLSSLLNSIQFNSVQFSLVRFNSIEWQLSLICWRQTESLAPFRSLLHRMARLGSARLLVRMALSRLDIAHIELTFSSQFHCFILQGNVSFKSTSFRRVKFERLKIWTVTSIAHYCRENRLVIIIKSLARFYIWKLIFPRFESPTTKRPFLRTPSTRGLM